MAEVLVLDAAIRDWVLIPLSVVMMVLIGFLGYSISNLMDSSQSPDDNSKIVQTYMAPARNLRAKSFRANEPVNLNFGFDRKPDLVLGPCDGIFCLYWRPNSAICSRVGSNVERLPTIALWNPATRAFSILPVSNFDVPPYRKVAYCMVGFGFDLTTKSIKVVKVVNFHREKVTRNAFINCAEVYELGSGSWRVLNVDDIVQEVYVSDEAIISMYNHNDGVFHWHSLPNDRGRGVDTDYVFGELVLSFDMSTELFQLTLLPERYTKFRPVLSFRECHLALLGDSLAAIFSLCEENHTSIEVWVMKKDFNRLVKAGESFSSYRWSHEFTVEPPPPLCICISVGFWNKNELLIWTDVQPFDFRSRGSGTPLLYDMVTKQARDLQISEGSTLFIVISFGLLQAGLSDDLSEDPLDNVEFLQDQLECIPYLCGFQEAAALPALADNSELVVVEAKLGAILNLRQLSGLSSEHEAELSAHVLRLINVIDCGLHSQRYGEVTKQRLDRAVLIFFQHFRKSYIGDQAMHSSKLVAYFAFLEVLLNSHIAFVLNLDTSSFRYIVGSLESGLGGLDANILSQFAFAVDNLAKPAAPNLTPRVSDCPDVVPKGKTPRTSCRTSRKTQFRLCQVFFFVSLFLGATPAASQSLCLGYVVVFGWIPSFCQTSARPSKPRMYSAQFTMHGPSLKYVLQLSQLWPSLNGEDEFLWEKEWDHHGRCCFLSMETYLIFGVTATVVLTNKFMPTISATLVSNQIYPGGYVNSSIMSTVLSQVVGGFIVTIRCDAFNRVTRVKEIVFCIDGHGASLINCRRHVELNCGHSLVYFPLPPPHSPPPPSPPPPPPSPLVLFGGSGCCLTGLAGLSPGASMVEGGVQWVPPRMGLGAVEKPHLLEKVSEVAWGGRHGGS
ncbi:hypothetical protein RHGRI_026807 [Rhododendron griersonianum]|uniref:ER membrane protein complex subunit 3 n=1 Tax=Rhododendron griersonianum TaxID=479676 RepID=A0AAV6IU53_9ERIC|nr:hypothetical protein RHGRI_026807 [Rhododendron griersonianum]